MSKLNNDWSDSLSDLEKIKPCLESGLGIELVIIDKSKDRLHAVLDQIAGIDALAVKDGKVYGIAFRIQRGRNWKTFTIRSKRTSGNDTEFQKYSVQDNCSKPNMTMQIYADDAGKLHVGYCKTSLLMTYAHEHEAELPKRTA